MRNLVWLPIVLQYIVLPILCVNGHDKSLYTRKQQPGRYNIIDLTKMNNNDQKNDNDNNISFHRRLYNQIRQLLPFTDNEVRSIIFQRHNAPPEQRNATLIDTLAPSDIVTGGTSPTKSPQSFVPTIISSSENKPTPSNDRDIPTRAVIPFMPTIEPSTSGSDEMKPSLKPFLRSDQPSDNGSLVPIQTSSDIPAPTQSDIPTPSVQSPTIASDIPSTSSPGGPSTSSPAGSISDIPTLLEPTATTTLSPAGGNNTDIIIELLSRSLTTDGTLLESGTPQNDALIALITNFPELDPITNENEIIQIYSLNTIYYSTSGAKWKVRTGWTGPTPVCGEGRVDPWYGLECNDDNVVLAMALEENDLVGNIPSEIAGLFGLGTFFDT